MTAKQFMGMLARMGLSQAAMGRFLGVSERTASRYATGDSPIPIPIALLLRCMQAHGERPIVPTWKRR